MSSRCSFNHSIREMVVISNASLQGDLWTVIDTKQLGVLDREGRFDRSCRVVCCRSLQHLSLLQRYAKIIDVLDF